MNISPKLLILLLAFQSLAANTIAQEAGPREQFQAAVGAFQKSATEDNARKLAALAKQLDPSPAVPDDARFHALKGAAFVKQTGDAAAFAKAAGEFRAAIALAPWVGEYHYNLAVCEKSAGQFPAALTALKFANLLARDDKERDDCLALRAELEAAQELAAAKKTEADAVQQKVTREKNAEAAKYAWILGDWIRDDPVHPVTNAPAHSELVHLVKSGDTIVDSNNKLEFQGTIHANGDIVWERMSKLVGRYISVRVDFSADRREATIWWPIANLESGSVSYRKDFYSKLRRN